MDRRDFLKVSGAGAAGVAAVSAFGGMVPDVAVAATRKGTDATSGRPWKFGVMADTQWKTNLDGLNPGTCAVGIINLLNAQFAHHGVSLVVQCGDLVDKEVLGTARTMPVRAQAAEALYDCGIGFFPLRGNHESSAVAAGEFQTLYPQAQGLGARTFGASNFSSPFEGLKGLSYSFDVNNVRFVMLDQFTRTDGTGTDANVNIIDQLDWIETAVNARDKATTHAFVFSHKNLIGQNHVDCLFGSDPSQNADARNRFIGSLGGNGVRYALGGHDHMHHRSIVASPDGNASVKQVICSSNSYKFYTPWAPQYPATLADPGYIGTQGNDVYFDNPPREQTIAQEIMSIGYYIFTVDGPRVTVDFYATTAGQPFNTLDGHALAATPVGPLAFYKRDSWGYSLNGREFVVAEGGDLSIVGDTYMDTTASLLGGTNGSTSTNSDGRKNVKTVNTGWSMGDDVHLAVSEVLHLWGLNENLDLWDNTQTGLLPDSAAPTKTDTFALSMTFRGGLHVSRLGIAAKAADGGWVNAVDLNAGGTPTFVNGPWNPSYGLGTWGVDARTHTAWAVVNHQGEFAVTAGM